MRVDDHLKSEQERIRLYLTVKMEDYIRQVTGALKQGDLTREQANTLMRISVPSCSRLSEAQDVADGMFKSLVATLTNNGVTVQEGNKKKAT